MVELELELRKSHSRVLLMTILNQEGSNKESNSAEKKIKGFIDLLVVRKEDSWVGWIWV